MTQILNYTIEKLRLHLASQLVIERIVCENGFSMSVQAGEYNYCYPKEDKADWTHVEVGYPSERVPELDKFTNEDFEIYYRIPIELILEIIANNGGLCPAHLV